MSCDIALVTCAELPDLDPDDRPLAAALRASGLSVEIAVWDSPDFDWASARLALLRNPWDYFHRLDEFLAWGERVAAVSRLQNPLDAVRWNLHKRYLVELDRLGAPVVPTVLVERGGELGLGALVRERGWGRVVVKPAVSADSWRTLVVDAEGLAEGQAHLDDLAAERDVLVQPFLDSVESEGERCLVFLDGAYSHAIRKNSLTRGGRWAGLPEGVAVTAEADELEAARAVLARIPFGDLLYARVDLVRDGGGRPRLLELELVEPTLFLTTSPAGLERLVGAIGRRLARG
ncbi:MAG TPA: hypothetical protein VLA66_06655 [Thermoanaerobaculia bacterium]|nr:hypothetical protein [Thermoanaerobaculia bacterium]